MTQRDVMFAGIIVFTLAIVFFATFFMSKTVLTQMQGIAAINQSAAAVTALQGTQNAINMADYVILGVFIGLVLGIIITAWFVGGNAIFMFIYFLMAVISVIMSVIFSNVWETVVTNPQFATTITSFPITNNLMSYLPIYIAILSFIGIVVMFAKPYFGGEPAQ